MLLTIRQSYDLLAKHGVFGRELCDKCGVLLGAIRFTRRNDSGAWCSRECRDGVEASEPGRCRNCRAKLPEGKRRGSAFCDDACRKACQRQKRDVETPTTSELSRTKPSIYAGFHQRKHVSGTWPHPSLFRGPKPLSIRS